ncbi:MAG: hypothetical protein QOE14_305 [Humisphaera sp.]|nr:hypothetical protein [Humisphaera sp.]
MKLNPHPNYDVFRMRMEELKPQGRAPRGLALQRLNELRRKRKRLAEVIDAKTIGPWFNMPNRAFGGLKPLEIIERGEIDRIWTMIYQFHAGPLT